MNGLMKTVRQCWKTCWTRTRLSVLSRFFRKK